MNREEAKKVEQKKYFKAFLQSTNREELVSRFWDGDDKLKEPDIVCEFKDGSIRTYELTEYCNPEVWIALKNVVDPDMEAPFAGGVGDIITLVQKKLDKSYIDTWPVDLLIYADGFTSDTFRLTKQKILENLDLNSGQFQKIWLMFVGEETGIIYERSADCY